MVTAFFPAGEAMFARDYQTFARANARFLGFGFAMAFASSVGQTFFIGVFGPAVRGEFGLTHTSWSAISMVGTLASALALVWSGAWIDRLRLGHYTAFVCLVLVGAAAFMAWVPHAAWLVLAIFFLRQAGQRLASHVSTVAMARFFDAHRGKAVAFASLGFAASQSVLPFLAVVGIAALGWRASYAVAATVLALGLPPLIWWLLRGSPVRGDDYPGRAARSRHDAGRDTARRSWSRADVLRHRAFYLLLPAVFAPSVIHTALFFHGLELAAVKGWGAAWFTGQYWLHALGTVLAALVAGPLIDRVTAARVLPGFLAPMGLAMVILWAFDGAPWALPYLFLMGITVGLGFTVLTALWAEVYGVGHLGAIRALAAALSSLSSALGPLVMGALMDAGVTVEAICGLFALLCAGATGSMLLGLRAIRHTVH